jgi:hypothetical protein
MKTLDGHRFFSTNASIRISGEILKRVIDITFASAAKGRITPERLWTCLLIALEVMKSDDIFHTDSAVGGGAGSPGAESCPKKRCARPEWFGADIPR